MDSLIEFRGVARIYRKVGAEYKKGVRAKRAEILRLTTPTNYVTLPWLLVLCSQPRPPFDLSNSLASPSWYCCFSLVPWLPLSFSHFFRTRTLHAKNRRRGRAWYGTAPTRGHLGQPWPWSWRPRTPLCTVPLSRCLVDRSNIDKRSRR